MAEVYLNGELLGTCKLGFVPFGFDLTKHLQIGKPNVLAVMCDNRFMKDPNDPKAIAASNASGKGSSKKDNGPGGSLAELSAKVNETIPDDVDKIQADQIPWNNPHWHPAHGGLYRNVKLHVVDPLHISLPLYDFLKTAGPYIFANDISDASAKINVEVPVENGRTREEKIEVTADVLDRDGKTVLSLKNPQTIGAGKSVLAKLSGDLKSPQLWEPAYPYLYRVVCSLKDVKGQTIDTCEVPLGIRHVTWDVKTGFSINGHPLKLHGWGQKPTNEWPGLGAAQPNWLHFFTIQLMKDAGGNFIRWGHSAAGMSQIEASDRLGLMVDQPGVDGESDTRGAAWKLRSDAFRDVLIYFRNNPSILIWEGGNQKVTREHAKELKGFMDEYDPHGGRVYAHRRADKVDAEFMGIGIGTEGGQEIKDLPVVEGEYMRDESPRRVWDDFTPRPNPDDPAKSIFGYPEAKGQTYQENSEQFAVNEVNQYVSKLGAAKSQRRRELDFFRFHERRPRGLRSGPRERRSRWCAIAKRGVLRLPGHVPRRSASAHYRPLELPRGHEEDSLRGLERRCSGTARERQVAGPRQANRQLSIHVSRCCLRNGRHQSGRAARWKSDRHR